MKISERVTDSCLVSFRRFAKVDGSATGKQAQLVEQLKHFAARLVDRGYHCPLILSQSAQHLNHKERRGTAPLQQYQLVLENLFGN